MGEVAEIIAGHPLYRFEGDTGPAIPIINIRDLEHAADLTHFLETAAISDPARFGRARILPDDVIVTARGTQLRSVLAPARWQGAVASSNLMLIRPKPEILLPELLSVFLQSPAGVKAFEQRRTGTQLLKLTLRDLAEIEVPVPPLSEQRQLADLLRSAQDYYVNARYAAEMRLMAARQIVSERILPPRKPATGDPE
ncbi:MAG: restriction endonuclease subunit S [Deltaproteobacteria bacterium]|nr:restriction endonuclease subunit S [Deltaproteobacteria bacterium]